MISLSTILGLARAEARLARRLVRYWIFIVLALLITALQFMQFWFIHKQFSWASASAASANPRYFVGNFGALFMMVFFIGLVFLSFDLRARDRRDRIEEVVDTLPFSNLELILGRALGVFFAAWIPLLLVAALMAIVARLIGTPIEPWSILAFITLMSVPAYVFAIGLVFLVTLLVRHRLIAAIVSLLLLTGLFIVGIWWIPFYWTPFTDLTGGYVVTFPSDIVPGLAGIGGWLQRTGYLLAGLGFLWFAAAVHPRKDDSSRGMVAALGGTFLIGAAALCSYQVWEYRSHLVKQEHWRAVHDSRRGDPGPDVRRIEGDARIDPARRLTMALELTIGAPGGERLDRALFTLNPGLIVQELVGESGSALEFTHEDGLLDVQLASPLGPGDTTTLALAIEGRPDPSFAYFDASFQALKRKPVDAQIFVLGFDSIVFDRRYVALMPGVRWLPASGSEMGRDDPRGRPRDFYGLDLTVDLPEGWLVAGPGRRQDEKAAADPGRVAFRFAPQAPVPDVALVAAPFESRSTEIDGVFLELLTIPKHAANPDFFDDATGEIKDWLGEHLREAAEVGLAYPYGALTLVEAPNLLRGYGGGWKMDSTLIQPAMILMRESGFPTANFKARQSRFDNARDQEGGVARAKRRALVAFFENDMNGGNPFTAAARSFFGFQTSGAGPEGVPLDHVWENLTSELVTERRGFFSVHFFDQDFGQDFILAGQAMNNENRVSDNYSEVLIHRIVSNNKVWDTVVDVSLLDLDPAEDPERTINVLSLKGGAMAESMLDDLGREKTGQMLAALRETRRGETYTRDDVIAAGDSIGEDLSPWLDLWIDETALPGFQLGDVRYHRLGDAEDGSMQYQLLVTVRNGEKAPGLLRLEYRTEEQRASGNWQRTEPAKVGASGAIELGLVTSQPLRVARIAPYLALNRDPFNVPLPALDQEKTVDDEPFVGVRETDWLVEDSSTIVVDDLDDGFAIEESDARGMFRVAGRGSEDEDLDQGLPIAERGLRSSRWSRMGSADAHGKYRRTVAVVRGGEGDRNAAFRAELPHAGQWELEYYYPGSSGQGRRRTSRTPGTWQLIVEDSSGKHEVEFDAEGGELGWNSLGRFEMATGEAIVRVSDKTEGDFVMADAIRWTPVSGGERDKVAALAEGDR